MKKFTIWVLAFIITIAAAYYQRKTGPTYPREIEASVNGTTYKLKLTRSLGLNERPEVKLAITDTTLKARLYYRKYRTNDQWNESNFRYKVYPVNSFVMNKIFKMYEEKGFFAELPVQPPAGKLEYYIDLTDSGGTRSLLKDNPVIVRFKGSVPAYILVPHILIMFLAMLFSTAAAFLALFRVPEFRKYSVWTLVLLVAGGMILGPIVQKYAFGDLWTGIPFGWDLTDNKTLIATIFWVLAVIMNRKKDTSFYTVLAAVVLLLVFSIPHSMFGSELNYESGKVTQGLVLIFSLKFLKNN
jgi:hypothetical protein